LVVVVTGDLIFSGANGSEEFATWPQYLHKTN